VAAATAPNQHWSMDFVHDQMLDGRRFRILTVIDQWSRESVSLEPGFSLTGRCVGHALDEAAATRGLPKAITVDNGTEFTSKALDEWAYRRGIKLDYTRPRQAHGQWADRVIQRAATRRVPERARVRDDA
jgi:putative transposase